MFETTTTNAADRLKNHPRALGALFATTALLAQTTPALAHISGSTAGP